MLFWNRIETLWLCISFVAVLFTLAELNRTQRFVEYQESETKVLSEYHTVRNSIYGATMVMVIDSSSSLSEKESIGWFHKMNLLLEQGYNSLLWRKFLFYTRAYVFRERGYMSIGQDNQQMFTWPTTINFDSDHLKFKDEMRHISDKLIALEAIIDEREKLRPDTTPLYLWRHVFFVLFTLGLALKLVKNYADLVRTRGRSIAYSAHSRQAEEGSIL
jgi:hypothetical protein